MKKTLLGILLTALLAWPAHAYGGVTDLVYQTDYRIDSARVRQLSFELDNLNFAQNDEFQKIYLKGYTLPGLWLQPKFVYYPLKNIKLELGGHFLLYHGAINYPAAAYQDIALWKGNQYQKGAHCLPFFRAQVDFSEHFSLVFGNLYGASNHRLIEPLYSPELNLSADPEAGLQLLFNTKHFEADIWGNWQSFIFKEDTHQEAFTVGLSSRVKINDPKSAFHLYIPVQVLAQHRGGEIDTIYTNSVQTLLNAAAGVAGVWNAERNWLKRIEAEVDAAYYNQMAGKIWPCDAGYGLYARVAADIRHFRLKAGYWYCDSFISLFGLPFFGAMSTTHSGSVFERPHLLQYGLEYARPLGKGFSIGVDVEVYQPLHPTMVNPDGTRQAVDGVSFTAGVYLRINPSFLIKQF